MHVFGLWEEARVTHANSTQKGPCQGSNQEPSCWEATVPTTKPLYCLLCGHMKQIVQEEYCYICYKQGTAYQHQNIIGTVKYGGGRIIIWACVAA